MLKKQNPFVRCDMGEVFLSCPPADRWKVAEARGALAGESKGIKPPFRIPAADTKKDLFFDDLELLSRFANMPLPDQEAFLVGVRALMSNYEVEEIHLEIEWSSRERKIVKIKSNSGILDIFLEGEK